MTSVRDRRPEDSETRNRLEHARFNTPYEPSRPGLEEHARARLKGPPVRLSCSHAERLLVQFQEICRHRGWSLIAVAIMWNHFHVVINSGDTTGAKVLTDLKAYASRELNAAFGRPVSGTWWTMGGSRLWLPDENAVVAAIAYVVEQQPDPLLIWQAEKNSGR